MKYIIDIPDDTQKIIGFRQDYSLIYVDMTPYSEPDRKAIEDEVWATAIKIDIASEDWNWQEMTYQEAKAKYEEWKKQKDEIRAGDEVRYSDGDVINAVVIDEPYENGYIVLTENGCVETHDGIMLIKTGRHFNEIEELLKKMGDEK